MKTIDNYYFESLDQIGQSFYDWERQLINVGCSVNEINLSDTSINASDEGKLHSAKLVHEYIHYLQNFATSWGAPVFTDFILAIMKIGASSAVSKEQIILPLEIDSLKNSLLVEGFNLRKSIIKRINKCGNVIFDNNKDLKNIDLINPNEECATLSNGRITAELGIKVIREHMAHIGTQLYLDKSDEEIHNYNKSLFTKNDIKFSKKPEYWILFEYLYENHSFNELGLGVFHLCQNCLITLNPEKALLRFVNWFSKNQSNFSKNINFIEVVEQWLMSNNEMHYLYVGLNESIKHCERILTLTNKHKSTNEIFLFTNNITEYALNNIKQTKGGRFLFNRDDKMNDLNFWKRKMIEFGTGLIKYLDNTTIHGSDEHCEKMTDSFNFLLSSSLVLKKILDNQRPNCPFLEEIPICGAKYKGEDNCYTNPFLMIKKDTSGKECLFGNGVLLTGMESRVQFSKLKI